MDTETIGDGDWTLRHLGQKVASALPRNRPAFASDVQKPFTCAPNAATTDRYHLHKDELLKQRSFYLPKAVSTIWRVLKDGGRIPTRVYYHYPVERPDPMQHWEMDFGQLADCFEFLTVVDRGTSILVNTAAQPHYNSQTALGAVMHLFI